MVKSCEAFALHSLGMHSKKQGTSVPGRLMRSGVAKISGEGILHAAKVVSLRGICCLAVTSASKSSFCVQGNTVCPHLLLRGQKLQSQQLHPRPGGTAFNDVK